jgi:hypothetical protein
MSTTYEGTGVPEDWRDVDPAFWPPHIRRLDEAGEVLRLQPYEDDYKRWGVAVPREDRPGRFHVVRYAHRDAAEPRARGQRVSVAWAHSGRRGRGDVEPLVATSDLKRWVFVATGWDVPL